MILTSIKYPIELGVFKYNIYYIVIDIFESIDYIYFLSHNICYGHMTIP